MLRSSAADFDQPGAAVRWHGNGHQPRVAASGSHSLHMRHRCNISSLLMVHSCDVLHLMISGMTERSDREQSGKKPASQGPAVLARKLTGRTQAWCRAADAPTAYIPVSNPWGVGVRSKAGQGRLGRQQGKAQTTDTAQGASGRWPQRRTAACSADCRAASRCFRCLILWTGLQGPAHCIHRCWLPAFPPSSLFFCSTLSLAACLAKRSARRPDDIMPLGPFNQ